MGTIRPKPGHVDAAIASPSLGSLDPRSVRFSGVVVDLLRAGLGVRFHATGRSMSPTIREGEAIVVMPTAPADVRRGDIILHNTDTGLIAHRVARVESADTASRVFILRGDASTDYDRPVHSDQVLGKVVSVERASRGVRLDTWRARFTHRIRALASRAKRLMRGSPSGRRGNRN